MCECCVRACVFHTDTFFTSDFIYVFINVISFWEIGMKKMFNVLSSGRYPIFFIFIGLALGQGVEGIKPEISPTDPEIYINEGDSLELTCTSTKKMEFFYPNNDTDTIATSPVNFDRQDFDHNWKIVFQRARTVYGDTGWYGCADQDANVYPNGNYNDSDVNWTYVYVKSNSSYFVQSDNFQMFQRVLGSTVILPCRPTSPDYNVVLIANDDTQVDMDSGNVSYDPRIGFKLNNVTLMDSGYFMCSIDANGQSQQVHYSLHVMRKHVLNDVHIREDGLRYVTRGQTLRVNCSTEMDVDVQYSFNWMTPFKSNRTTTRLFTNPTGLTKHEVTSELTINGVIDQDEGTYTCTVNTFSDKKNASAYITVYDPDVKYINLKSEDNERLYQKEIGDYVQWVVNVDAYPQPTLKWLNNHGDEIIDFDRSKYAIKISSSSTIMRINRLDITDMGLYSLQATNQHQIKTINFTLQIMAKPMLIMEQSEAFYMPHRIINISCQIVAFPAPNISWSYLEAPNYPTFEGSRSVPLYNSRIIEGVDTVFRSVVSAMVHQSGYLSCTACNILGCDSAKEPITLSDVQSGFGIIESTKEFTEGDDIRVTCAASIYNYTGVDWLDENENPIEQSEKVIMTKGQTEFTHRSELRIINVDKSINNSLFVCRAMDHDGLAEQSSYKIQLYDPVPPYFIETNINKTTIAFDLKTEGHKTVVFKCYVGGMPPPNVTWYKDENKIISNDQYMCLHKNQELHIKYLLDGNGGRYTCKAENRFGAQSNYQIVTIKGKDISRALIMSIVALVTICIGLVVYFSIKMHREKVLRRQLMEAGLTHFEEGALECLNPELPVDDQAELLPYDKKWEFPREKLKFGKQLGSGAFGVVMKAEAQGICDSEAVTTVAVKMVRQTTESTYIRALASELKIMVHLGKHLNVVNLLGACTKNILKRELLVIVEYCRFGNLHNYLLRHRAEFIDEIDRPSTGKLDTLIGVDVLAGTKTVETDNPNGSYDSGSCSSTNGSTVLPSTSCVLTNDSTQPGWRSNYNGDYKDHNLKPICTQDLLSWAFQVARGMEYLSQRKVLHGDLAARNILLAENNIVKICDFGLAKTMYKNDNYKKEGDAPLPIKWMAIESIRDRIFSTQSDVWSFGIVLWEFFTLAKTPYPGMEAEKQYQRLIAGYRMEQPEYATDQVYDIMLRCWKAKPNLRPTFTNLVTSIGDLLEKSVKEHYVDLNAPYLDMNTTVLETVKNDYLTMMTAPNYDALSSPSRDYVNSPCAISGLRRQDDSYIPMRNSSNDRNGSVISDDDKSGNNGNIQLELDSKGVELLPMLSGEEETYLEPMNVAERRAEFMRNHKTSATTAAKMKKKKREPDLRYCNTLPNVYPIETNYVEVINNKLDKMETTENVDPTDSFGKMPGRTNNSGKNGPASFSNPSYIIVGNDAIQRVNM